MAKETRYAQDFQVILGFRAEEWIKLLEEMGPYPSKELVRRTGITQANLISVKTFVTLRYSMMKQLGVAKPALCFQATEVLLWEIVELLQKEEKKQAV